MSVITDNTELKPGQKPSLYWRFNRFLERHFPSGLYQRSLLIVIVPMVLLQSIMVFIVMERHWDKVTKALSRSVARDIALTVGKRWGILTSQVIGGAPDFADVYNPDRYKAFKDAWIAALRSSFLMHETYEITEINPKSVIPLISRFEIA